MEISERIYQILCTSRCLNRLSALLPKRPSGWFYEQSKSLFWIVSGVMLLWNEYSDYSEVQCPWWWSIPLNLQWKCHYQSLHDWCRMIDAYFIHFTAAFSLTSRWQPNCSIGYDRPHRHDIQRIRGSGKSHEGRWGPSKGSISEQFNVEHPPLLRTHPIGL